MNLNSSGDRTAQAILCFVTLGEVRKYELTVRDTRSGQSKVEAKSLLILSWLSSSSSVWHLFKRIFWMNQWCSWTVFVHFLSPPKSSLHVRLPSRLRSQWIHTVKGFLRFSVRVTEIQRFPTSYVGVTPQRMTLWPKLGLADQPAAAAAGPMCATSASLIKMQPLAGPGSVNLRAKERPKLSSWTGVTWIDSRFMMMMWKHWVSGHFIRCLVRILDTWLISQMSRHDWNDASWKRLQMWAGNYLLYL